MAGSTWSLLLVLPVRRGGTWWGVRGRLGALLGPEGTGFGLLASGRSSPGGGGWLWMRTT